jgi:hypothetical protein
MKRLLVAEFLDEIESFVSINGREELGRNDMNILALRPEIQSYLKGLDIPYMASRDFFDRRSHEDLLVKSDDIIQSFRRTVAIEDDTGIREGYNNTFLLYVRCFIHYMLFLIETIDRCVDDLKISHVVCPDFRGDLDLKPLINNEYRYLCQISQLICDRRDIAVSSFHVVNGKGRRKPSIITNRHVAGMVKKLVFVISLELLRRVTRGKNTILSSSKDYNVSSLMDELHDFDKNVFVIYLASKNKWTDFKDGIGRKWVGNLFTLPDGSHPWQKATFMECLDQNTDGIEELVREQSNLLKYRDVDFSQQVFERIRYGLRPFLLNLYGQTISLNRVLNRCRPRMVLAPHSREITYNLGELAKQSSIPALLISHGSHVPPRNGYERIEWSEHGRGLMNTHYEYVAVQTPWAKAYLGEIKTRSRSLVTGPLLFGRQIEKKVTKEELKGKLLPGHEDRFIILNASTPKTREVMRFYVYETVDEYIANTNDLIEAVEGLESAYLIVRFRPLPDLNEEDFARLLRHSDCYGIYSSGTFGEYLLASDLLVSYSSTAIEEALQNEVPVLQYDQQGKYCHVPAAVLKPQGENRVDSCYFVDSKDNLAWALNWVERHHHQKELAEGLFERHRFKKEEITAPQEIFQKLVGMEC